MTSNIVSLGEHIALPVPPLDLRFAVDHLNLLRAITSWIPGSREVTDGMDAVKLWSNESFHESDSTYNIIGDVSVLGTFNMRSASTLAVTQSTGGEIWGQEAWNALQRPWASTG
jgi:hypothetical protein